MSNIFTRSMMTAVLAVVVLVSVAGAQSNPSALPMTNIHPTLSGTPSNNGGVHTAAGPKFIIGWNYVHATNCYSEYIGTSLYFFVFPIEGDYYYTSDAGYQRMLAPLCAGGNLLAFDVTNYSGDWNGIFTFDSR